MLKSLGNLPNLIEINVGTLCTYYELNGPPFPLALLVPVMLSDAWDNFPTLTDDGGEGEYSNTEVIRFLMNTALPQMWF